jgi:hypothetical protein
MAASHEAFDGLARALFSTLITVYIVIAYAATCHFWYITWEATWHRSCALISGTLLGLAWPVTGPIYVIYYCVWRSQIFKSKPLGDWEHQALRGGPISRLWPKNEYSLDLGRRSTAGVDACGDELNTPLLTPNSYPAAPILRSYSSLTNFLSNKSRHENGPRVNTMAASPLLPLHYSPSLSTISEEGLPHHM